MSLLFVAETIEYALVSSDTSSILFDIIRFLLQAIFATMEEEKESYVEVVSGETNTFLNIMEEELEEKSKEGGSPGQTVDGKAEEKSEPESEEGGERGVEDAPLSDEDVDTTQDGEVEKPLDVRVESIKASALTFAKWSHLTQHAQLSEMALDPYTCTEILRLHLLSSGGYTDSGDRSWFRHAKRAGYTDSDDPAIALRLRRPDIIESLARTSIYSLTPADKVEVLSTLCSQLLSYSITREHIEDAAMRAKRARKLVRKLQFSEERRKKEEKSALHKEKMRQKREEKEKRTAQNTRWVQDMDNSVTVAQTFLCILVLPHLFA